MLSNQSVGSRTSAGNAAGFTYQPALDGLRGVAVAMVVLFHAGTSWMRGGYVGVSVFFTLSGYLITSLLIAEHAATGTVNLGEFYMRRIKRLMPAGVLCLLGVAMLSTRGWFPTANHVRREVVASALQVANWNSINQRVSYADLVLGGTGPLDHFWSLAIEEQFYWVWPLAFVGVARIASTPSRRVVAMIGLALVTIGAAPLIAAHWGPDVAYFSTPARLGEILTGAALATVLSRRHLARVWWAWLAVAGSILIALAAVFLPSDHGFAYQGWLGVGSLATVALIAGVQTRSPLRRLLCGRPVVELGRISYGVYVFHWPIFAILTQARTGWNGPMLFTSRIAATLAIAIASFHLLEQPVRRRHFGLVRLVPVGAAASLGVVAIALIAVPVPATGFGASVAAQREVAIAASNEELPPLQLGADDVPSRAVRVLVLGDSTAEALSAGMIQWAAGHPTTLQVSTLATPGCGFVRSATIRDDDGTMMTMCDNVLDAQLPALLRDTPPDVVVVMITLPDITPRTWDSSEGELPAVDARYAQRKSRDYARLVKQLATAGVARVLWLDSPLPSPAWLGYLNGEIDPALWIAQRSAVTTLQRDFPAVMTIAPFGDWLLEQETSDPRAMRPDGLHLSAEGGTRTMNDYLASVIVAAGLRSP